jgi:hypothetical protein
MEKSNGKGFNNRMRVTNNNAGSPKNVDKERKSKTGQRLDGKISNARNKRIDTRNKSKHQNIKQQQKSNLSCCRTEGDSCF